MTATRNRDVANIDAVCRMIRAAGRTVAGFDPDQLARLSSLHDEIDAALLVAVAGMREAGVQWSTIGEALGVTPEACIMRFGRKIKAGVG